MFAVYGITENTLHFNIVFISLCTKKSTSDLCKFLYLEISTIPSDVLLNIYDTGKMGR